MIQMNNAQGVLLYISIYESEVSKFVKRFKISGKHEETLQKKYSKERPFRHPDDRNIAIHAYNIFHSYVPR